MHQGQICRIGHSIGQYIASQYPLRTPEEAALSCLNFSPRDKACANAYEEHFSDFVELFFRAFLCSLLERHPCGAFRLMVPDVRQQAFADTLTAFHRGEYNHRLSHDERDALNGIFSDAGREFFETLYSIAERREDAKMICIALLTISGKWQLDS